MRGRPRTVTVLPVNPNYFTVIHLPLFWSEPAKHHTSRLRSVDARLAVPALLTIIQSIDDKTQKGWARLRRMTEHRQGLAEGARQDQTRFREMAASRAALERLAGEVAEWSRPSNTRGHGAYRVAFHWSKLPAYRVPRVPVAKADVMAKGPEATTSLVPPPIVQPRRPSAKSPPPAPSKTAKGLNIKSLKSRQSQKEAS